MSSVFEFQGLGILSTLLHAAAVAPWLASIGIPNLMVFRAMGSIRGLLL